MLRMLALSSYYWILAQDGGGGGGAPFDLGVFGIAGTTIAILLFIIKTQHGDNKELRSENMDMLKANATIQQEAIERVANIAAQSSEQLRESAQTLEATTVMMHTLAGRPGLSPELLAEVNYHLRSLREQGRAPQQEGGGPRG